MSFYIIFSLTQTFHLVNGSKILTNINSSVTLFPKMLRNLCDLICLAL